ncbi:MAG: hypothetical protein IT393_11995 [Nitrospirae bacterium]|nr:hypothetical protein [Nitrospirota bacterium]
MIIYFLALLMSLSLVWAPASFAGYKDVDAKIAEQEIASHIAQEDVRFNLRLQKGGFEKGVAQGMWDAEGKLTARATAAKLKSLKHSATGDVLISSQNADIKISITDIKELNMGMKFKQAKFTWKYNPDVPSLWKRFIVAGGSGYAAFMPDNDGWRYDGMELAYSEEPFQLTAAEIAEEQKEMQQLAAAKGKEEETRRRLQSERQRRIEESKKAGKQYGTFSLATQGGQESCSVSDAGVTCQRNGESGKKSYSIMFADVKDVRKTSYPGPESKQYYAIELTMREAEAGTGSQGSAKTSWRNVDQWISDRKDELDKFLDVLSKAHAEWRTRFSDIADHL